MWPTSSTTLRDEAQRVIDLAWLARQFPELSVTPLAGGGQKWVYQLGMRMVMSF